MMKSISKIFRVFKVIACTVLILLLCAEGVSAETNIDLVAVTDIDDPVAGAKPDYNGAIASGADYTFGITYDTDVYVNGIAWEDHSTGEVLDPETAVFEAGHVYTVWVQLIPKTGYEFPYGGEVEAYINGDLAVTDGSAPDFCNIHYTFPAEPMKQVAISGILTPREGCLPDDTVELDGFGYEVSYADGGIEWYDVTGDGSKKMAEGQQFEEGHEYMVFIYLETLSGCRFATIPSGDRAMVSGTINGRGAMVLSGADPYHEITVSYTFKTICNDHPFTDVTRLDYFYEPVLWALHYDVTKGTSATTFAPDDNCTRAQIVTFLWRASGSPEPVNTTHPFTDVEKGSYYEKAVIWAVEKGITSGTSATKFSPNIACTRAQAVTFLWRSQGSPISNIVEVPFVDVEPGSYYAEAVLWAVQNDITNGTGEATFSPENTCTRGQIVTFLWRTMEQDKK